jgi:osmotically-inducible protein OsmY
MNTLRISLTAAFCLALGTAAIAQAPAPDNSKSNSNSVNSNDKMMGTADAQKNDASDVALTQQIRKSVVQDKSLSSYAHNVKIVTVNGRVTLNGVVRDASEKNAIEMKAQAVAGKANVTDALTIAPP